MRSLAHSLGRMLLETRLLYQLLPEIKGALQPRVLTGVRRQRGKANTVIQRQALYVVSERGWKRSPFFR